MNTRKSARLTAIVATMATASLAFAAPIALATEVEPANKKVEATLQPATSLRILFENAYSVGIISCDSTTFSFTTPTSAQPPEGYRRNTNRTGTGPFSLGAGSVSMAVNQEPQLKQCSLRELDPENPEERGTELHPVTFVTSPGWTIVGTGESEEAGRVAVGIPASGIVTIFLECELRIGPKNGTPALLTGTVENSTHKLRLDGQVPVSGAGGFCGAIGAQPAQIEADFNTEASEGEGLEILP